MTDTTATRLATRGQCRELAIAFTRFGLTDRAEALGYCASIVGRPVSSRKTLTTREASAVLDHLEHHVPPRSAA
jgi:hypothetical protein